MAHEATHVAQQQTVAAARTTLMRDVTDYLPDISVTDVIPDWILDGVRDAVRAIPGYTLLTYITGTDPLTDEPVPVSHEELIETLLTYGPFGAAVGAVLQAIDVLGEIFTFVTESLDAHDLTLARIKRDIDSAWDELSVTNGIAGNVAIVARYVDAFLRDVRALRRVDRRPRARDRPRGRRRASPSRCSRRPRSRPSGTSRRRSCTTTRCAAWRSRPRRPRSSPTSCA